MKTKKIISAILALCLVCGAAPSCVQKNFCSSATDASLPPEKHTFGMFEYFERFNEIIISGCDKTAVKVEIPEEIDGLPVTQIDGSAFYECRDMEEITIPDSIEKIGKYAFWCCESLTSVTIPESVCELGDGLFMDCKNLESVVIPDSVENFGEVVFYGCEKLESVNLPEEMGMIDDGLFYDCKSLKSVTIPETVTYIGVGAFHNCESLTEITIPESVTTIADYAFIGCKNLAAVSLTENVTEFGDAVFSETEWLDKKTDENPLFVFNGILLNGEKCSGEVAVPDGVKVVGCGAFVACDAITSVTIPESVEKIDAGAFMNCKNLESVVIPENVKSIGLNAFSGCTGMEKITILNPDCDIYADPYTIEKSITICSYADSEAYRYARLYRNDFEEIGGTGNLVGDANCDGSVNIADATAIVQYIANPDRYALTTQGLENADCDGISGITPLDAIAIQKLEAGMIESLK